MANLKSAAQNVDEWVGAIAEQIRNWGNSSLAEEFLNAHKETSRTIAATVQFVAIPFERELTAAEQDRWDAAQEAAEEAFEHFERVLSEASAFCKKVDEKGGA